MSLGSDLRAIENKKTEARERLLKFHSLSKCVNLLVKAREAVQERALPGEVERHIHDDIDSAIDTACSALDEMRKERQS